MHTFRRGPLDNFEPSNLAHVVQSPSLQTSTFHLHELWYFIDALALTVAAIPSLSRISEPNMKPIASSYPKGTS